MAYISLNYLATDSLFTEEELMIRQTVRDFVAYELLPVLKSCHREEKFPQDLIPRFAELGLLGSTIKGYDCPGLNDVAYGLVMQELERGIQECALFVLYKGLWSCTLFSPMAQKSKKKRTFPP